MMLTAKLMLVTGVTLAAILVADAMLGLHATEAVATGLGVGWCLLGVPVVYLIWRWDPKGANDVE